MAKGISVSWRTTQPGSAFVLRWAIASVVGWFSAALLVIPVFVIPMFFALAAVTCENGFPDYCSSEPLSQYEEEVITTTSAMFGGFLGLLVGAILGIVQWLVLRREAKRSALWILGNVLGVAAVLSLPFYLGLTLQSDPIAAGSLPEPGLLVMILTGVLAGLLAGLVEWPMFPPRVYRTPFWPLWSTLIWAIATIVSGVYLILIDNRNELLVSIAIIAFVQTILTAIALLWMFRRRLAVDTLANPHRLPLILRPNNSLERTGDAAADARDD